LVSNSIKNDFKCYFNDIGLLVALHGKQTQVKLLNDKLGSRKGGIYENFIADVLVKKGYKLYFYEKNREFEIDFIIETDSDIRALEIKSSNTPATSLIKVLHKKENKKIKGFKLHNGNFDNAENYISVPLYVALFIDELEPN
jgi:predicted AAA+ superfamily ATPase